MRRPALAGLLPVLVAVAFAGCSGGDEDDPAAAAKDDRRDATESTDTREREESDNDQLEVLLADRAAALAAGEAALLRETADGGQRLRDTRALGNLRELALAQVRMVPVKVRIAGDRAEIDAGMSYRVKGATRPFLTARDVHARRTEDGWKVTRDVAHREPLPWEVDRFTSSRARNIVLLTPPGVAAGPLMPGLSAAYRQIARDLPARDLPERVLVIAARNAGQGRQLHGRPIGKGVVAMASVAVDLKPDGALEVERVLAQRMLLVMDRFATLPAQQREWTLAHEMVHTALDPDTSGRVPRWLAEGIALHVSGEDLSAYTQAVEAAGERPTLAALSRRNAMAGMDAEAQGAAYVVASAAAEEIVARHGNEGLFAFLEAFNRESIPGPPGAATTDKVLRKTLGTSLRELDAQIR